MRSRYRVHSPERAHFITSTTVAWLPVFTTARRCDILLDSLAYCREHKALKLYAWVVLDNHFHAIVSAVDLPQVVADLKRHTTKRILAQLEEERAEWLLNQLAYQRAKHKSESTPQLWQEGYHPQSIPTDAIMLQKLEYVHMNPVHRGLVAAPEHWRYSSAHEWLPGAMPLLRVDGWR
jgi:REP element-mobilizing transposase RayT